MILPRKEPANGLILIQLSAQNFFFAQRSQKNTVLWGWQNQSGLRTMEQESLNTKTQVTSALLYTWSQQPVQISPVLMIHWPRKKNSKEQPCPKNMNLGLSSLCKVPSAHMLLLYTTPTSLFTFDWVDAGTVLPTLSSRNVKGCELFTPKWHLTLLHAITQCSMDERAKFRFTARPCLYSWQHMSRELASSERHWWLVPGKTERAKHVGNSLLTQAFASPLLCQS